MFSCGRSEVALKCCQLFQAIAIESQNNLHEMAWTKLARRLNAT